MSADDARTDKLKVYWEYFFKSETGTYEKSTWLDLFLAEFLLQLKDGGQAKELITFCPISGIVTLVGCELLCGIHRVTSSVNSQSAAGDPALAVHSAQPIADLGPFASAPTPSADILRKYILGGVAWRCLVVLEALGVEGLSCCRQLSSVLIWLFGELTANVSSLEQPPNPHLLNAKLREPIHLLFSNKIWSKQKFSLGQPKSNLSSPEKEPTSSRSKRAVTAKILENPKKKLDKDFAKSTESYISSNDDDLEVFSRSHAVKVVSPTDDFEYFNSPIRSGGERQEDATHSNPFDTPKKVKPKPDDYMNEEHRRIINSDITPFEFTLIITDLLQELCKAESSLSGSEGSQISVQCINFSLRNLCALQFGSSPVCSLQYSAQEVSRVKLALTELLMVSLDKVLIRSDLCAKLINNGILPMLLRILEDVTYKLKSRFTSRDDKTRMSASAGITNKDEYENISKFIFGIAYSIAAFFYCLLMQCRTVDKLKGFTEQFKLYADCQKGGLLKECIEVMIRIPGINQEEVSVLIKKLIESIGRLITAMKRVRSEVIHSAACPRGKHKICRQRVLAGMHHHHDVLGEANVGMSQASPCCVSVLYKVLTSTLIDEEVSAQSALRSKILRVMLNCGVCCCISPGLLMENIVRLMLTHCSAASLCLTLLEHTVYGDLGASVLMPKVTDQLPCAICEPDAVRPQERADQRFCPHISSVKNKTVWSFLIHYNSLLQLDNHNGVLHSTVSHLLRITPKCRIEMKYELLFSVIYPTFIVAKHRYIIRQEESAYFLTVSCLNIFASLLNAAFAEQFIQKGGLSYVLELVALPEFSKQCCSILEITIIVEIFRLIKDNSGDTSYYRELGTLSSVQMLMKSLQDMRDKCLKIYRLKLPGEKYEELCDVTDVRKVLGRTGRKGSSSKPILVPSASEESVITEESLEGYLEVLKNIWTFWKCCATLCLCNPMFRQYLLNEDLFLDTYRMLKVLFHYLSHYECAVVEMRIVIKILECLLTIQFAVSEEPSHECKELSSGVVRAIFVAEGEAGAGARRGAGVCVRAVCEMLIRVATTCASADHVMPPLNEAKLPPLVCSSTGSSLQGSSSDDSLGPLCDTEPTDPAHYTGDEGYEADVEVGKLDASLKSRKTSLSSAIGVETYGHRQGSGDPLSVQCREYTRTGALSHPELCVIVIDILTQLIQRLLEQEGAGTGAEADSAAVVSLGRACCARLSAAVLRAAPCAPLIHRLLSGAVAALLTRTDTHLQELQHSILELVRALASQSISPRELSSLLQLWKASRPPLHTLLTALARLVDDAQPNRPDCILFFPVGGQRDEMIESSEQPGGSPTASHSHQAENQAKKLCDQHTLAGIRSSWSTSAMSCCVRNAGWSAWLQGFAVMLWLRVPRPPAAPSTAASSRGHSRGTTDTSDEYGEEGVPPAPPSAPPAPPPPTAAARTELLHVLSVGHDSLMLELWLQLHTGSLTLKLSRPDVGSNKILSEVAVEGALPAHHWNLLAFNVKEIVCKKKTHIQVTLFINGRECETVSLPLPGILVRKATPVHVLVGSRVWGGGGGSGGGAWLLGNAAVLRAPLLSAYSALYVTARGTNASLLANCQMQSQLPNYPSLLTPDILDCNIDWDQVFSESCSPARELQDSLLLSFSSRAPTIINLYHQTTNTSSVFATTAGLIGSAAMGAGAGSGGAASTIPETLFVTWNGTPLPSQYKGLPTAAYMLGGSDVFLFLFARVVELEGSAEEQALALSILLKLCRTDNRLYSQFHERDTLSMLHTVMATDKSVMSHHLLKVFLDEACSSPVLVRSSGRFFIMTKSDAIIVEPKFLVFLISTWNELEGDEESECPQTAQPATVAAGPLPRTLLLALLVLVRDEHPRRAFNLQQLERAQLLQWLLRAIKERFLSSGKGALPWGVSTALVELTRALLTSAHVPLLLHFLLLMHQASNTYITHSRANFYFLLSCDTKATSEYNLLNFMSKRKSSKRSKKKDLTGSSSDTPGYLMVELKPRSEPPAIPQEPEEESSVDSTKEMKGLINMQMKERSQELERKEESSSFSTLENSDTTLVTEQSEARESTIEQQLIATEYIVIDYDEMEKPAAATYPAIVYPQSDVLSVAYHAWSVVEGLMLLLHNVISVMSDIELAQMVGTRLRVEVVVVLGNHWSADVRAAVVRVLAALQRHRAAVADMHYIHAAHQISLYPASWELVTACAMLITQCDASLEDQMDEEAWSSLPARWWTRSLPLLALLPRTLDNIRLAHNLSLLLHRVVQKASLKVLTEISIVEVVVRSLGIVASVEDSTFEGRDLILDDLRSLLNQIAIKALTSPHSMQTVHEIHYLVSYGEGQARCGGVLRDSQCSLYQAQLAHLEDSLHAATANTANYFTSVLSSAVSLSSEASSGGSGAGGGGSAGGGAGVGGAVAGVTHSELAARHRDVLVRAVNFILAREPQTEISCDEIALIERLYCTLLNAVSGASPLRPKWWASAGADCAGPLQELFLWMVSPGAVGVAGDAGVGDGLRAEALRRAYHAPPAVQALLTPTDPSGQRKLSVYLLCSLKRLHMCSPPRVELAITDWARAWALNTHAQLSERVHGDALAGEAHKMAADDAARRRRRHHRHNIAKVLFSKEGLANKVINSAMSITRQVVDIQNEERKALMEQLRRGQGEAAASAARWQRLVDDCTHEQALWHDEATYPTSWELDPTEGPGRVRVRLRRCHLNIDNRFLKEGYKRAETASPPVSPLSYLLSGGGGGGGGGRGRGRCGAVERVRHMARVTHVTVAADTRGDLLLSDTSIVLVPDESECCGQEERPPPVLTWPLASVTSVATRRWCLRELALEVFLAGGHAHLLAFSDPPDRDAFVSALATVHMPNCTEEETLNEVMSQWRNGTITNWEYLMKLNALGGRSYNDLMQYPVMPFVLADYSSRVLDLTATETFRDLRKPMAIQNKNREAHYINIYNDLRQARREGSSPLLSRQPHHYASLYSNSGAVLHYLVRLPPFTRLFLSYQDNNFDMPDRTFHSLQTTWRLITNDSPTDVKELIPEFFYLPEFLKNNEGLSLGVRQCGLGVDRVELPPWAPDARLFTLLHRHALEAAAVRETLPHWLDLVFGYKQTGPAAVDALNVYPACVYYGFDPAALPDEVSRRAAADMVRTYGQAPRRLLRAPHPHAAVDLHRRADHQPEPEVWAGVSGGLWGSYCGSPGLEPAGAVVWRAGAGAARVCVVPGPRAAALAPAASLVVAGPDAGALCQVSWRHADCAVRLKRRRDAPPDLLFHVPALDQITSVCGSCVPGCPLLFGFASGLVRWVRWTGGTGELRAHAAPVADMAVSVPFSVLVTASEDGRIVVWDLNMLSYVRTLPNRDCLPATLVAVSDTLCDVATVHGLPPDSAHRSLVAVHTVNGEPVGSVRVAELVRSVCYSRAPEGLSVNALAAGLHSGAVKLYSSWDLRPLAYLAPPHRAPPAPLVSMAYSWDCSVLVTVREDGAVACWESGGKLTAPVRLLSHQQLF